MILRSTSKQPCHAGQKSNQNRVDSHLKGLKINYATVMTIIQDEFHPMSLILQQTTMKGKKM